MKSFKELRDYGRELFKTVGAVQEANEEKISKYRAQGIYNDDFFATCQKKADEEVQKAVKTVSGQFSAAVKETIEGKRTAINIMLTTPPTADQVNILTALQLQGKNISEAEIRSIAAQLTGNYRALHTLQTIGLQAGIRIHIPTQYDFDELNSVLNQAETYLKERVHALETYTGNQRMWDFHSKAFFGVWEGTADQPVPYYGEFAALLDGNEQTTPGAPVIEKRELTDVELRIVEGLFSDTDVSAVMRRVMESPELRALVALHPEYGKMIR